LVRLSGNETPLVDSAVRVTWLGKTHSETCDAEPSKARKGGSDRDRSREIDVVELPLVPFLYSERLLRSRRRSGVGRYAAVVKGPRIPRERWSAVAAQVQRDGLRAVACELNVSHETVRGIVKRVMHDRR
jgi:hypothetical protein